MDLRLFIVYRDDRYIDGERSRHALHVYAEDEATAGEIGQHYFGPHELVVHDSVKPEAAARFNHMGQRGYGALYIGTGSVVQPFTTYKTRKEKIQDLL